MTQLKHVPSEQYQVCLLLQIMIILIPAYARLSFKSLPLELNKKIKVTIITVQVGLLGDLVECSIKIKKSSQITGISITYMYLLTCIHVCFKDRDVETCSNSLLYMCLTCRKSITFQEIVLLQFQVQITLLAKYMWLR